MSNNNVSTTPKTALLILSFVIGAVALVYGILAMAWPGGELLVLEESLPSLMMFPLADIVLSNFFWFGFAILLFVFLPNAIAFAMLVRRSPSAPAAQVVAGILLVLCCLVAIFYVPTIWTWLFVLLGIIQIAVGAYANTAKSPSVA